MVRSAMRKSVQNESYVKLVSTVGTEFIAEAKFDVQHGNVVNAPFEPSLIGLTDRTNENVISDKDRGTAFRKAFDLEYVSRGVGFDLNVPGSPNLARELGPNSLILFLLLGRATPSEMDGKPPIQSIHR